MSADLKTLTPTSAGARKETELCPLCGGQMASWLTVPRDWRRPKVDESYRLHWCEGCSYGQLLPRPDRATVASYYEGENYYTHARDPINAVGKRNALVYRVLLRLAWQFDHEILIDDAWLRRWLAPGARVCDIGCGKGAMLSHIRSQGFLVCGVEPDAAARGLAREDGLEVFAGTAEELPKELGRKSFGGVMMSHMLEHCLDPCLAVANAASLLAPGGTLMIETPNNEARTLDYAGIAWPWLDVPRHLNFFTARSLERICRSAGLKVVATQFRGYARQYHLDWQGMEDHIRQIMKMPPTPPPWKPLLRTMLGKPRFKYDSVRVIATPAT